MLAGSSVVRTVHHLVPVVLLQDRGVVADALDEQVLPAPVEPSPLHACTGVTPVMQLGSFDMELLTSSPHCV